MIVVTSGEAGDGKTTTASNVALSLAMGGKRVLLIDADLRRPRVHEVFQLTRKKGLSGFLAGKYSFDEVRYRVKIGDACLDKLDVVVAGQAPEVPMDLIEASLHFE